MFQMPLIGWIIMRYSLNWLIDLFLWILFYYWPTGIAVVLALLIGKVRYLNNLPCKMGWGKVDVLFAIYVDSLILAIKKKDLGCHIGESNFGILTRRRPRYFANRKRPRGGGVDATPPGFLPSRPNFLKLFLMGMFSGSRNPTVIMKKFYLHCMTLKIKVKHLFAWPFLSPVVNMIQSWSWCRF